VAQCDGNYRAWYRGTGNTVGGWQRSNKV